MLVRYLYPKFFHYSLEDNDHLFGLCCWRQSQIDIYAVTSHDSSGLQAYESNALQNRKE